MKSAMKGLLRRIRGLTKKSSGRRPGEIAFKMQVLIIARLVSTGSAFFKTETAQHCASEPEQLEATAIHISEPHT